TYAGTPTVTSISPSSGSLAGGTLVTITGTNLDGATEVDFGAGNPVESYLFVSNTATQIQLYSPASIIGTGTVDVTVTVAVSGTTATGPQAQFTYMAPTITGITPNVGPLAGGNLVTISGTSLEGVTEVDFGAGNPVSSYDFYSVTSTQIEL